MREIIKKTAAAAAAAAVALTFSAFDMPNTDSAVIDENNKIVESTITIEGAENPEETEITEITEDIGEIEITEADEETEAAENAGSAENTLESAAEETHVHKECIGSDHEGCTHGDTVYKPFPYELFTEDNHQVIIRENCYLTKDLVLDEVWGRIFVDSGSRDSLTVNLCLNGYSIIKNDSTIIEVFGFLKDGSTTESKTAILNICDCQGGGCIKNTSENAEYSCVDVNWDSMLNLYSGTIESRSGNAIMIEGDQNNGRNDKYGSANIYGGTVRSSGGSEYTAVWLYGPNRSLNVYGGEITADGSNAVYAQGEGSRVTISGGKVIGKSDDYETVCAAGDGAVISISGGQVIGENCGAIYCKEGTVNITGGEVSTKGSTATCIYNNDALIISDGRIACDGYYAVTNRSGGKTTISGGEIKSAGAAVNNKANSEVKISGGNINSDNYAGIYNYGNLSISGGTITAKGTYAIDNYENADLKISGGTVEAEQYLLYNRTGGKAEINGGKLIGSTQYCVWNNGTMGFSNGEITSAGFPVKNIGTFNISGGSFKAKDSSTANYIENKGALNLCGSPAFDNTSIWLRSDFNIGITGALTCSEPIPVYIDSSTPRIITNGWSDYMEGSRPSDYFKSPYSLCTVGQSDGEAVIRRFVITFNANGGNCPTQSTSVDDNGQALSLPEATREEYNFAGWYTAEENGEKVTDSTVFTADTELYAHWSGCEHTWGNAYESDLTEHWKACTKCGAKKDKADHLWDNGMITKEPSENETGIKTYTCDVCGAVKRETLPAAGGAPDDGDNGNVSKEVQQGENTPASRLETSVKELISAVLTPEEQNSVKDGIDIKIILTVEDATENVPLADKEKTEAEISRLADYKLGQYLDINLLKKIGGAGEIKITETNAPITITFELPNKLKGKSRTYSVIRVHNGETAVLHDLDDNSDTVTIKTDKFSIYALAYSEAVSASPGGNGLGNINSVVPNEIVLITGEEPTPTESTAAESESTAAADENNTNESEPTVGGKNPSTGSTVSLIPSAAAIILTAVLKRKRSH